MAKIQFTVLGTSAGMPQADRGNSGYVLDIDGRLIQLDCGGGVSRAFRKEGFDPLAVERIIISHTHPDHVCDLPLFIQMLYLAGRQESITIHLPEEAVSPMQSQFRAMYLIEQKLPFDLRFMPIFEGEIIGGDEVTIQPIANSHLQKYAPFVEEYDLPNKQQCYSFLITTGAKKLLYSADLGSEADVLDYLPGLDVLVIESTHIDLDAVLAKAVEEDVGRVILTHIAEEFDTDAAEVQAQKLGYDRLEIARDGIRIDL